MAPTFTQLTADNLTTDANPIDPTAWLQVNVGDDVLEVTHGSCTTTVTHEGDGTVVNKAITWPHNQYAQVKLARLTYNGYLYLYLRGGATDDTPAYGLAIDGPLNDATGLSGYSIVQYNAAGDAIVHTWANQVARTFQAGDTITFAVYDTYPRGNLYFFHNGTLVFVGALNDSSSGIGGGSVGMQLASGSEPPVQSDIAVNYFTGGSFTP